MCGQGVGLEGGQFRGAQGLKAGGEGGGERRVGEAGGGGHPAMIAGWPSPARNPAHRGVAARRRAWVRCGCPGRRTGARSRAPSRACRPRSEEHTSELQSLMRISYAVFCLKNKKHIKHKISTSN